VASQCSSSRRSFTGPSDSQLSRAGFSSIVKRTRWCSARTSGSSGRSILVRKRPRVGAPFRVHSSRPAAIRPRISVQALQPGHYGRTRTVPRSRTPSEALRTSRWGEAPTAAFSLWLRFFRRRISGLPHVRLRVKSVAKSLYDSAIFRHCLARGRLVRLAVP
jgi:hypothetical protein